MRGLSRHVVLVDLEARWLKNVRRRGEGIEDLHGDHSFKLLLRAERCGKQLGRGRQHTMAESVIDMVRAQAEAIRAGHNRDTASSAGGTGQPRGRAIRLYVMNLEEASRALSTW